MMVSSIGNMPRFDATAMAQMREKMFAKIDADGDGSLTQSELEAAAKADGSRGRKGPDAAQMIADFGADGDGALSKSEMDAGFKKIDDQMRSAFLQMQETESSDSDGADLEELFAALDSDGDGTLSQAELEDGEDALKAAFGPPPGPPPAGGPGGPPPASSSDSDEDEDDDSPVSESTSSTVAQLFDELDTNKDGTVSASELVAGEDKVRDTVRNLFGPPAPPSGADPKASASGGENAATGSASGSAESKRQQMLSFLLSLQEDLKAA